jgi:hypothetical protein
MKKIAFLGITMLTSVILFAQQSGLGLKAGLNVSHLQGGDNALNGSKLGLNAGILGHLHINNTFAVQPEIMYSSQGAKYTNVDGVEHELSLNYINIPLNLQYMFNNGFRLQTGPQVGFLVGVKDKENGSSTNFFSSDDFKSVDFSWTAGLGYVSTSGLGVDARYNFGISNINDFGNIVRHNSVFQVGLFYMLNTAGMRR